MFATPNLRVPRAISEDLSYRSRFNRRLRRRYATLILCIGTASTAFAAAENPTNAPAAQKDPETYARETFRDAYRKFQADTNDYDGAWMFGRACFDLAEFATNNAGRASLAETGIRVCRRMVQRHPTRVEARYYLGMNLGQLARTRTIGALRIVNEMEEVFLAARERDAKFDYAGPDRNLGLLYLEAPVIGSIGSRRKALQHLRQAVELFPNHPENRLNLAEAYLKWGEHESAEEQLAALKAVWDSELEQLTGPGWIMSWRDWERRLAAAERAIAREKR